MHFYYRLYSPLDKIFFIFIYTLDNLYKAFNIFVKVFSRYLYIIYIFSKTSKLGGRIRLQILKSVCFLNFYFPGTKIFINYILFVISIPFFLKNLVVVKRIFCFFKKKFYNFLFFFVYKKYRKYKAQKNNKLVYLPKLFLVLVLLPSLFSKMVFFLNGYDFFENLFLLNKSNQPINYICIFAFLAKFDNFFYTAMYFLPNINVFWFSDCDLLFGLHWVNLCFLKLSMQIPTSIYYEWYTTYVLYTSNTTFNFAVLENINNELPGFFFFGVFFFSTVILS